MCKATPGVCVHLECAYTWSVRTPGVCACMCKTTPGVCVHLECAYTWSVCVYV